MKIKSLDDLSSNRLKLCNEGEASDILQALYNGKELEFNHLWQIVDQNGEVIACAQPE